MNAADNKQNDKKMSKIDVTVTETASGGLRISVKNDGKGIPIALHDAEKIYIPQLIFGNLLTGSNFDDEKVSNCYFTNISSPLLCTSCIKRVFAILNDTESSCWWSAWIWCETNKYIQ